MPLKGGKLLTVGGQICAFGVLTPHRPSTTELRTLTTRLTYTSSTKNHGDDEQTIQSDWRGYVEGSDRENSAFRCSTLNLSRETQVLND